MGAGQSRPRDWQPAMACAFRRCIYPHRTGPQAAALVSQAGEGLDPKSPDTEYVAVLLKNLDEQGEPTSLQRAIVAIRTEAGQLF